MGCSWTLTSGRGNYLKSTRSIFVTHYSDHAAIYIDSDDDFVTLGLPGSGTSAAPYMIENLNITTSEIHGIYVSGTTKHFVIQNCYVLGYQYGIRLLNIDGTGTIKNNIVRSEVKMSSITLESAKNILVEGNDCCEQYQGIILTGSSSNMIKENNCSFNGDDGITTSGSGGNNNIIENHCEGNTNYGISISSDDDADYIAGNICPDNTRGIYMYSVNDAKVVNNTLKGNDNGIYLSSCYYFTIDQNFCENNDENGIQLSYSGDGYVTHNTIRTNNENGIKFVHGSNNIASHNLIQGNSKYGIWINGSAAFVSNNDFINNYAITNPQAYDFNGESVWYNATTNQGNYWSDWTGTGAYNIAGKGTTDPYPLSAPVIAVISTTTSPSSFETTSPSSSKTTYPSSTEVAETTPYGFELVLLFVSVCSILFWRRKRSP